MEDLDIQRGVGQHLYSTCHSTRDAAGYGSIGGDWYALTSMRGDTIDTGRPIRVECRR